jgi:hypothetical protein
MTDPARDPNQLDASKLLTLPQGFYQGFRR